MKMTIAPTAIRIVRLGATDWRLRGGCVIVPPTWRLRRAPAFRWRVSQTPRREGSPMSRVRRAVRPARCSRGAAVAGRWPAAQNGQGRRPALSSSRWAVALAAGGPSRGPNQVTVPPASPGKRRSRSAVTAPRGPQDLLGAATCRVSHYLAS
jgi:hypothetical protein